MMFDAVPKSFDLPEVERETQTFWDEHEVMERYLRRNDGSSERFRFLDGPITANGPMGVHHAWGRTYKDLWQRYHAMLGKKQRFQNGFDCQGLWVEVTVERKLGFNSKRDIEEYGVAEFVRRCKEDVFSYADLQTRQSKRLGYFMDWDNSYYTLSDENNYTIWHFLKECHRRGLIYRGTDVMPWCTRCGTGLSEHEISTDGYQELTHRSVYVRFPLVDRSGEYLLVWTTTPWTLTSNVAVAVNPELTYVKVMQGQDIYYLSKGTIGSLKGEYSVLEELPGQDLVGRHYRGPFDELPAASEIDHRVVPWGEVSEDEGTGLVHIAPGCGKEDFALGREFGLAVVAPIDQDGIYADGFGWLSGRNVQDVAEDIIANLKDSGFLYRAQNYTHRYPTCWRCQTELVFRLVDEWFISMDPLREPMMQVARSIQWLPSFGLERELDWLRNMDDWMISKKRYWGLALPFWICSNSHMHVIGGKEELYELALSGLDDLESPHRPWIDEVVIRCPECGESASRVPDVGNVWLDAGIVPYSTLHYDTNRSYWKDWFPADFITESFPGQFRNWFYSMIAMSTVLENTHPFRTVLGYALMRDARGRDMHKSWGNLIPFDEAAERAGADSMRWLFALHNVESNLNFGWEALDEVKRRLLVLWNTYSFFVTYANVDGWTPGSPAPRYGERPDLDRWALARLHEMIGDVRSGLDRFDAQFAARSVEAFIEDLSTWYVRRSRRRFWKAENDGDKQSAYVTLHECLTTLSKVIAPFTPFLAESLYRNLERDAGTTAPLSVHLCDFPATDASLIDAALLERMALAKRVVALGRAARERVNLKVRQPLARIFVHTPTERESRMVSETADIIREELNIREVQPARAEEDFLAYTIRPNLPVLGPRFGKRIPQIRAALERLDPAEVARGVSEGRDIVLEVDGQKVHLEPTDILASAHEREGYAAMAADGYLVALDTTLTPDLVREGLAREVVRRVNDWRKAAGLNVEDRIRVRYRADPELRDAVEEHKDYICQETLATDFSLDGHDVHGFMGEANFGGQNLTVRIERVPPVGKL